MRRSTGSCIWALCLMLGACAVTPIRPAPSPTVDRADPTTTAAPSPSAPPAASPSPTASPEALAWSPIAAAGPSAREDHTWTVDPHAGRAYLFGGRDGATILGDTWVYNLSTDAWTELLPESSPAPRFGHEAVWVDGIGLVVFAGQGSQFFGDLWSFDPDTNTWAELAVTGDAPTPRYGSCAAVGPDGRLWISHGFTSDGTRFSDTRAYDFATNAWTDETPTDGDRPVERCLHGCWWTDAGELALFAGQTTGVTGLDDRWTLADGAWTRTDGRAPPARNLYARTRLDGGVLVFGGQALDESYLADLWLLIDGDPDAMMLPVAGEVPAGRAGAELVPDEERGRALLFGGRTADGALTDTWMLSGL